MTGRSLGRLNSFNDPPKLKYGVCVFGNDNGVLPYETHKFE